MVVSTFKRLLKTRKRAIKFGLISSLLVGTMTSFGYCKGGPELGMPIIHTPKIKFSHDEILGMYDMNSVRRGFQVYRQVCSGCHSLKTVAFRRFVDQTHSLEDTKAIAAEYTFKDGPDEKGEYFERPGKLDDIFPNPYPNKEAAKYANNGLLPPDLSFFILSHHDYDSYIFNLLNGYHDEPPAGVDLEPGTYFNTYAHDHLIGMAPPLYDGMLEYEDGTPATVSQMSRDIVSFMRWSAERYMGESKMFGIKGMIVVGLIIPVFFIMNRMFYNMLRHRQVIFRKINWK